MKTRLLPITDPRVFSSAIKIINQGGMVAFPTDTVYGLGVALGDPEAIEQLYIVKGREATKAIAVLIGNVEVLALVAAEMSETAQRLARRFWPGPLTLVVPRHPALPANLSPQPTVGVRMPDHPAALELLNRAGPLATTSANLSGQPSSVTALEVLAQLKGLIPLIIDGGQTPGGTPSTVVDCTGGNLLILRAGPIPLEQIQEALS